MKVVILYREINLPDFISSERFDLLMFSGPPITLTLLIF
jgi:hypothetical protein